jgi:hypothetical protein
VDLSDSERRAKKRDAQRKWRLENSEKNNAYSLAYNNERKKAENDALDAKIVDLIRKGDRSPEAYLSESPSVKNLVRRFYLRMLEAKAASK